MVTNLYSQVRNTLSIEKEGAELIEAIEVIIAKIALTRLQLKEENK